METQPVCSGQVNMTLHGYFTKKTSKGAWSKIIWVVEPCFSTRAHLVLISLLCCFSSAGLLVEQSVSHLVSLTVFVVKEIETLYFPLVWNYADDLWTACPEEQNLFSSWACAGSRFVLVSHFEESHTLPCSWTYQAGISWHLNCFLLQILLKLAIFAHIVICLNVANESCYPQESSTVYACSNQ